MTSSTQFSLFTVFVLVTGCGVLFSIVSGFGVVAGLLVVFVLLIGVIVLVVASVVAQLLLLAMTGLRRLICGKGDQPCLSVVTSKVKDGLPDIEFVIAAADKGIAGEPNSSIRFLSPPVEDGDVADLADLAELKWLVLDNTNVSDVGLAFFYRLTKLRRLYVRGSRVTAEGVQRLQQALPNVKVLC
jgi:hypothetical protein